MASHQQVADSWAQGSKTSAKGFNVFFEGDTIYSYGYHFPIAQKRAEQGAILFTAQDWSVSTSKHKSIVHRAIGYGEEGVFIVNNVKAQSPRAHIENHNGMFDAALQLGQSYSRSKKYKDMIKSQLNKLCESMNAYAKTFNVDTVTNLRGEDFIR